jgi:transcription elongation factor GreB
MSAGTRRRRSPGRPATATARKTATTSTASGGLREVDRRIRFLIKRLDAAEVVDPLSRRDEGEDDRVYFGATVTVRNAKSEERTVSIVGVDEIDTERGYISWVSPMARALLRAREGDTVTLNTPGGVEDLDILHVRYTPLATGTTTAGRPAS